MGLLQQAECSSCAVDLEEIGEIAAGAREQVLINRAQTLLVNGHAAAVEGLAGYASRPAPNEIAITQDVGIRIGPPLSWAAP